MGPGHPAIIMNTLPLNLQHVHALIVDDDPDTRFLNQYALEGIGVGKVGSAGSIQEMFHYLKECPGTVSFILMDIMLPGMDGIEGVRQLNQSPQFAEVPVIMLTTLQASEKLEEAFEAGAVDYVTKPFKYPELKARILSVLKKQSAFRQMQATQEALLQQHEALISKQRDLERNVYTDGLTQIPNRRAFDDGLKRMWSRSLNQGSPIGLLLADVDYFKRYNDFYGHQEGDKCLQAIAKNLPALTVDTLPARYGGEELAVVICGEKALQIEAIAEQIRQRILDLNIPHEKSEIAEQVTLSIGCVTYRKPGLCTPTVLVKEADEALYQAKHNGRNQVEHRCFI